MSYEVEWSRVYGVDKDPVREFLIYPVLLPELGDLTGSVVADFGCGNGGLLQRISGLPFAKGYGIDISAAFLEQARSLTRDPRIEFLKEDIAAKVSLASSSVDSLVSVFVLNEVQDIGPVLSECARVLKPFGRAHFVVTHPFLVAQSILHELYKGIPLGKLSGPMNYKSREAFDYHFTMSNAKARFYQKTFEDYVNSAYSARLAFTKMIEMRTDDPRFEAHPRYWYDRDIPKYLYFSLAPILPKNEESR